MAPPTIQKVLTSSDGVKIFTEASGDPSKPHVVLIHGLSFSGAVFDEFCQREDVLRSLYIVRADLRGHGRSGQPLTPDGHTSGLYADDYKAVIETHDLHKPVHVGWSLGGKSRFLLHGWYHRFMDTFVRAGMISPDICAHLGPDAISGIVFLSSLACVKDIWTGGVTPLVLDVFERVKTPSLVPKALTDFADACFVSDASKAVSYPMRCMWYGMGASQPQVCRALAMTHEQNTEPLWKAVEEGLPVCVIHGESDAMIFSHVLVGQMKAAGAQNLEVVMIPGAGHTLTWEEPNKVADALISFVERVWVVDEPV
ncbi:Alpha/Beta hydrolase protein [Amylostereum chailletii]|nr:Alpha/Beta hydrolase protein [Amylostereum chailletii]